MIRKFASLFIGETNNTLVQLFRYTLVGGTAFVVDFGALAVLVKYLGVHYLWAAGITFVLGLVTNYALSIAWVFDKRALKNWPAEFTVFALLGVMGLGLNELLMFVLTGLAGLDPLASKMVSTAVTFLWNFISRKVLLFSLGAPASKATAGSAAASRRPSPWDAAIAPIKADLATAADVRTVE